METVNEKSVAVLTLLFKDEDGALINPSTASYRVDDKSSGSNITAATTINPVDGMYDIVITAAQNAIVDSAKVFETKVVTVSWTYGTGDANAEYEYRVKNLLKVI